MEKTDLHDIRTIFVIFKLYIIIVVLSNDYRECIYLVRDLKIFILLKF